MILNTLLQTSSTVHGHFTPHVCVCVRSQVRAPEGDSRGLLWVLDEEMVTPGSTESTVLERVCQSFSGTGTSVILTFSCDVWSHTSSSLCTLASQCASASSLCSVRSLTWWVQIQSAMISQAGSVRSRTIRLCWTPARCCRTPRCKRTQMIRHFYTALELFLIHSSEYYYQESY